MNQDLRNTEAYILAKAKYGRIVATPILANTGKQIANSTGGRSRIVLSHDGTAPVYFATENMTAAGLGLIVMPNTQPVSLCITDVGSVVNEAWFAFSTVGCNVAIIDVNWDEPQ